MSNKIKSSARKPQQLQSQTDSKSASDSQSQTEEKGKKGKIVMPEGPAVSRRKELESYSESDLRDLYYTTFAREADENLTHEQLVLLIDNGAVPAPNVAGNKNTEEAETKKAAGAKKAGYTIFKSSETGKEFKMSGDVSGHVVVRQVSVQQLNGGMVEIPNTETVQSYSKEMFDKLMEDKFFSESQLKIEILQNA